MLRSKLLTATRRPLVMAAPYVLSGAYANTLTGLIPSLYEAMDVVSRELVGFIPSVTRNVGAERAAVGQSVVYPVVPANVLGDITPAMTVPTPADQTIGNGTITITNSKFAAFGITGEEQKGLNNGPGYSTVQADLFAQALRALVNQVERDLATEAANNASRATGTSGTTPFGSTLGDSAQVRKILDDNGAPATGRSLVGNTTMGANLRTLANLTRANENGSVMTLRDGTLLDLHGFAVKESAGVVDHVKGTGASGTTNAAGYAIGSTTITLAAAGTGTVVTGDYVTFAGDANKYMIITGDTDISNGGTLVLAAPGLRIAIPTAATAFTIGNNFSANIGFSSNALHLVARAPALPQEGDLAIDRFNITDPRSGMVFEVSIYPGYRMVRGEVALAWGVKAVKREHIALLLG